MAQFKPADHSKGDANTIGGYQAVHDRPAAFEGSDGFSYSVEIVADETGEGERRWAGYLLFVKWSRLGAQTPEGHLETDYLARGATEAEALRSVGAMKLDEVKRALDACIVARDGATPTRRWWDAMRDEPGAEDES